MFKKKRLWLIRANEGAEAGGGNTSGGDKKDDNQSVPTGSETDKRIAELEEELAEARKENTALTADRDEWKGHSRKWEDRAKSKAQSSAQEDPGIEERIADLEKVIEEERKARVAAEQQSLLVTIASEEGVSPDDYQYLPKTDDADLLRKHAKRLATAQGAESNNFGGSSGPTRESIIERAKNL